MKKGLLYSIIALAAIVIVAVFGFQLGAPHIPTMTENMAANVLFVCPSANPTWDSIAAGLRPLMRYITGGMFFIVVLLMFGWGWQLYQNLLTDKFKRESFKNIWGMTKFTFWAFVIVLLLVATPNSFRRVAITGAPGNWVLCESYDMCDTNEPTCPNHVVHASAVHAR